MISGGDIALGLLMVPLMIPISFGIVVIAIPVNYLVIEPVKWIFSIF